MIRYSQGIKLYGIIYMHRISDVRVGGSARKNFNMFCKLCGEDALPNVVLLTSMWGEVTPERGAARERELATDDLLFKPALDSGANMLRYGDSVESARSIISSIMNNSPRALRIQEQLVDAQTDIADTDAGQHLQQELMEFVRKHRAKLVEVQKEMDEALQAKDMQSKKELERVRAGLEQRVSQAEHDYARLNTEFVEEKRKIDGLVQNAMSLLRQEQRRNADAQDELRRYIRLADSNAESFAADRAFWEQSLRQLEAQRSHEGFTVLGKVLAGVFMIAVPMLTGFIL